MLSPTSATRIPGTDSELNLKPIHSKAIISRCNLNLTVLRNMASYAAADCHFRQDAHCRMAEVIARIWRAEECEPLALGSPCKRPLVLLQLNNFNYYNYYNYNYLKL